ncbi:nucleotidyl transferase [Candidatus Caldarchaeum subterraneum]|uniref:Nucleotidyl transferase n=1 Tax=Caldiarchaeum subterraneum TaxID=311458 RepID=E6N7M2_CALS0|nr:nucleotidyl transferase [Candidatus Caldarchaeum subterraneum]BAJ51077.1 nucleotidyl transferase [Candidatus Caldarchaeum subterraneum]
MKAVLLSGGYGKRLKPLTESLPKPLLEVAGKPIIVWQIEWLKKHGIDEFIVCVGYLREKIIETLGSGHRLGVKIGYSVEDEPLGTGGALKNAEHLLKSDKVFLVLNGDVLTTLNPLKLIDSLGSSIACMALTRLPSPYGIVEFDRETRLVKRFEEKPRLPNYINAGVYAFTADVLSYLPEQGDLEKQTFPRLVEKKALMAVLYEDDDWISIDSHKDLEEAKRVVAKFSQLKEASQP